MLSVTIIMGFAFLLEACFGFGGGWIAIPLLSFSMLPKDAVFLMLVFQCLKILLLLPAWRHINWKSMGLLPFGTFFGILIGIQILDIVSPKLFRLGLATYLMIFVVSDYVSWEIMNRKWLRSKAGALVAGLSGGIISGITGMGGPAYVTYFRAVGVNKLAFRASIIFIASIGNFFRIFLDANEVIHNKVVLENFLPCLIVFVLVSIIGSHLPKFLSEKAFKTTINIMLVGSSLMLFYKYFA